MIWQMLAGFLLAALGNMGVAGSDGPIQFGDERVQRQVEETLGKKDPNSADMLGLKELYIAGRITDLSGIEYAENIEELTLNTRAHELAVLSRLAKVRKVTLSWYAAGSPYKPKGDELAVLPDLSSMESLRELQVHHSQISDISNIAKLPHLTVLTLEDNRIADIGAVSGLVHLERVVIDEDELEDLSAISNLRSLKSLELRGVKATRLPVLNGLENLEEVRVDGGELNDVSGLAGAAALKSVALCRVRVNDLSALRELDRLEKLRVCGTGVEDFSPLRSMAGLRMLEITEGAMRDVSQLAGLQKLERLDLRSNQIDDISALGRLENLRVLDLSGNRIKDVSALVKLPKLEVVSLYGNPLNKDAHRMHLPAVIRNNPDAAIACVVNTGSVLRDLKLPMLIVLYPAAMVVICMRLWRRKRKRYVLILMILFLLGIMPLPVREKDIEKVIGYSVNSLIDDQRIILVNGGVPRYIPFYTSEAFNRYKKLVYCDETNVDEAVYGRLGLVRHREEDWPGFDDGKGFYLRHAIIECTYRDIWAEGVDEDDHGGKMSNRLHFNYYFGTLGAVGYRVVIYRNVFGVFSAFVYEWVS